MNRLQNIDYTLLALYHSTKESGMLAIIQAFKENDLELSIDELRSIKAFLENKKFAVFQIEPKGVDYRSQITDKGVEFVENDSFSMPGTSILNL